MELVHEPKINICHLRGFWATYHKHVFLLIPMCKWFPINLKISMTLKRNIFLNIDCWNFLVGHVLVGVNPCGRCTIVALLPQIANLPKKSQNNDFKICELIWVSCILHLFWMRVTFCHLEMIWVEVWFKINANLISKLVPLKDHCGHSYHNLLHNITPKF